MRLSEEISLQEYKKFSKKLEENPGKTIIIKRKFKVWVLVNQEKLEIEKEEAGLEIQME